MGGKHNRAKANACSDFGLDSRCRRLPHPLGRGEPSGPHLAVDEEKSAREVLESYDVDNCDNANNNRAGQNPAWNADLAVVADIAGLR